jgi:hypothetical protein
MRPVVGRVATESKNPAFAGIVHAAEAHFNWLFPVPTAIGKLLADFGTATAVESHVENGMASALLLETARKGLRAQGHHKQFRFSEFHVSRFPFYGSASLET